MQAAAVAKITSQSPAGAGTVASDAAATDGVDFAALLAAQFQGMDGTALPTIGAGAGAEAPLQADGVAQDLKADVVPNALAEAVADPALQAMALMPGVVPVKSDVVPVAQAPTFADPTLQAMALMPGVAPIVYAMQQAAPEIKPVLSALPGLADARSVPANDKTTVLAKEEAAEFAVGGKSLPPGEAKDTEAKLAGAFKLPDLPVDAQRTPEVMPAVPAIMSANQPRAAGEIKTPVGAVQPPVGASGWGDALGQKIVWMAGQHQQVAELHLNPPNLGPMEVRLTINNDQVSALFVSHQPAVREAIEAAMPRLREMFADSGMMLGNATVSSDSLPQHQNPGRERQSGSESRSDSPLVEGYSMPLTSRGAMPLHGDGRGLVDLFA